MRFEKISKAFQGGSMSDAEIKICLCVSRTDALGAAIVDEVISNNREIAFAKMGCSKDILLLKSADRMEEMVSQCVENKLALSGVDQVLALFPKDRQAIIQKQASRFMDNARALVEKTKVAP